MSYTPNQFALTQKSLGISNGVPTDARSWYYDSVHSVPRPYISKAEVYAYLNQPQYRWGHFPVIINTGGTVDPLTGILSGGTEEEYWFRDGVADLDLIQKTSAIPTLTQILTAGSDSSASAKFSSIFIKGTTLTNMTELETNATTSTRKVTFPDVTGTPVFSINGITPNTSTGNAVLDFYTTSQVYTKAEVDAITGAGGGVAGVTTFNGRTGTVVPTTGDYTKSMVGLGNVDNTSDASKPISTATQTALDLKAPIASPTFTGTVSGITKAMVGLTNVDNTSDAAKPVSTATATALALKVDKVTGKSLILDTEITRLGTLRNTVITQGTNVTITGTGTSGDPYVINSTGGSSGSNIINVAGGTNTVSITGGTLIDTIVVDAPTSTTFKMGYTSGAEDVVSSTSVSGVQPINVTEYTKTTQTYYFTKASDTALKIYTR